MKYRVAQQPRQPWDRPLPDGTFPLARVEINGKLRYEGEVLDESEFRQDARAPSPEDKGQLAEVESLLRTGHIVEAL